jgi:Zn finger protein HypA/HybF involved in hydrogenase expression
MSGEEKKPFWAKCEACKHCWPACYLPMEVGLVAKIMAGIKNCPKCGAPKPSIAKQDDGKLLEPST